jgi:hypothetical protein
MISAQIGGGSQWPSQSRQSPQCGRGGIRVFSLSDVSDGQTVALAQWRVVPSKWLAWLKSNHSFQVAIDETGKSYPAKVQRIGAKVDPVSQSVKLSATIDGKFNELIAGMSGRVLMSPPAGN